MCAMAVSSSTISTSTDLTSRPAAPRVGSNLPLPRLDFPIPSLVSQLAAEGVHPDLEEITVLLIEDDQTFADMYRLRLELDGYRVIEARDGQTALEVAASAQPDLIFLDIKLPLL